ncbi:hypothetical protein AKJ37_07610 [candidate division MSBL1 archaeon SCGC-AAA259I09]|uniref:Citrate transporter-like domain-containing protein n=3 Tax=candidate division MSBL1 TaxID=215777 RepID=A0A133URU2_9EURY|nr:hypothetical protein AKJ61_04055 [candidate division MSBL1 archaeon SCGC-AAA259B11]KXA94422.1 hypothetical protein AKJ37_07610 [candidate division MSBL1 archaeon SCGC-AAA259I09]KXA96857.1 hypothetical protein AKJ38_02490 [candidate division MSBL1 archaeon SCGC-AAA259I14]
MKESFYRENSLIGVPIKVPTVEARMVLAVTALMAIWWSTEALPIPAVSLLPIGLFPILGVMETGKVTIQYANHLIFLFMGGFLIAIAIQKWDLHKRIALNIIRYVGTEPKKIILGFMLATAFLSMWISNTATCMMMITVATALLTHIAEIGKKKDIPEVTSSPS